jgi:hypothetical protein
MVASSAAWERQAGESPQAYAAFQVYRDLAPRERSASRVGSEYGCHARLIERWRSRHHWVSRTAEFDAERDRRKQDAMFAEAAEMGRRQAAHAAEAQAAVMRLLDVFATRAADEEELREAPLMKLAALAVRAIPAFATAAKVEREAHGVVRFGLASAAEAEVQSNPRVQLEALVTAALKEGTLAEVLAARGLKVAEVQDEARIQEAVEKFKEEIERLGRLGEVAEAVSPLDSHEAMCGQDGSATALNQQADLPEPVQP